MKADLWNRRAGWLGLVAAVLASGGLVQAQVAGPVQEEKKVIRLRVQADGENAVVTREGGDEKDVIIRRMDKGEFKVLNLGEGGAPSGKPHIIILRSDGADGQPRVRWQAIHPEMAKRRAIAIVRRAGGEDDDDEDEKKGRVYRLRLEGADDDGDDDDDDGDEKKGQAFRFKLENADDDGEGQSKVFTYTLDGDEAQNVFAFAQGEEPIPFSEYWIGLACDSEGMSDVLRAQLGIDEGVGLAVHEVVDDSPAQKAGFQANDVLLAVGDKKVSTLAELIKAVDAANETEISVDIVRKGEKMTLKVTPARRPAEQLEAMKAAEKMREQDFQGLFQGALPEGQEGGRLMLTRPGVVVERALGLGGELPDDLSVTITKKGDGKAEITVEQGDKKWEVDEDELKELPDEIRGPVEKYLGRMRGSFNLGGAWQNLPHPPAIPVPPGVPGADKANRVMRSFRLGDGDFMKQMEDLKKQLDDLKKMIDEMRKGRSDDKESEEDVQDSFQPSSASVMT
jgi:hypothetical protein